jgi:hypothetical protein
MNYISFCCRLAIWALLIGAVDAQDATQPAAPAQLTIKGDIPAPITLTPDVLAQMPRQTVIIPDQDGTKVSYEGVALQEILKRACVPQGKDVRGKMMASYVLAKADDGYQVLFSIGELDSAFGNESIVVADKRDGKPLFGYQGPLRLVCPNDRAGARSVRMLETIGFVRLVK